MDGGNSQTGNEKRPLMNPPHLLHIIQCAELGGMEKSTIELIVALRSIGVENRLVSLHPIGELDSLLRYHAIQAKGLSYRGPLGSFSIPAMAQEFRRLPQPDGIVMTGHNASAFAALTGMRCRRKILYIHFHHRGVKPLWQWRAIYAAAVRLFPRIAFCTDFIREEAEEIYPPLRSVSLTLGNSFHLPSLPRMGDRQAARIRLGIPAEARVVGNAGWLIERKRWDVFLRVAAAITDQIPEVVFLAAGDGPLRGELEGQCDAMGLKDRVRWLGWQKDLTDFYRSLDVLLFNSDMDALGRTVLEAGAYGVPTVASVAYGGLRDVISSEGLGFLIDRHDEEWLAEKTIFLLENPTIGRRIGIACRAVLAERHDPETNARELLRLLDF